MYISRKANADAGQIRRHFYETRLKGFTVLVQNLRQTSSLCSVTVFKLGRQTRRKTSRYWKQYKKGYNTVVEMKGYHYGERPKRLGLTTL